MGAIIAHNKEDPMSDRVQITITDHVAEVALARPEKMNALDMEMFAAIARAGEDLKDNRDVRAIILYGQGDNFCAGIDTNVFGDMIARIDEIRREMLNPPAGEVANLFQKPVHVWHEVSVPVIAVLQGNVFGGGAQIALAADFRIAAPDIRFSIMENKWGLVPDMGLTRSLPRLVRADIAKELVMTARILDGAEARDLGLVTRLADDPLSAARAFAADLAARSPEAIQGAKRLIDRSWTMDAADSLRLEAEIQAPIIGSPNQVEAVMANVQKRKPNFR